MMSSLFKWLATGQSTAVVFFVSQMFFEAGAEGMFRFADVEFSAFGAMNNVHDVVRLAVEMFGDVHLFNASFPHVIPLLLYVSLAYSLLKAPSSWKQLSDLFVLYCLWI